MSRSMSGTHVINFPGIPPNAAGQTHVSAWSCDKDILVLHMQIEIIYVNLAHPRAPLRCCRLWRVSNFTSGVSHLSVWVLVCSVLAKSVGQSSLFPESTTLCVFCLHLFTIVLIRVVSWASNCVDGSVLFFSLSHECVLSNDQQNVRLVLQVDAVDIVNVIRVLHRVIHFMTDIFYNYSPCDRVSHCVCFG